MQRLCPIIDKSLDSIWSVYAILTLGTLLRLIGLYLVSTLPLLSDALSYHNMALQLLHEVEFSPYWPPGLPYYLSFSYSLFGETEFVGRSSMILWYWVLSAFLYLISKNISNRKTANVLVLVLSLFPAFVYHSVTPNTQLPMAALLAAVVYFAIQSSEKYTWSTAVFLGLSIGLGTLTRPSSLIFIFFFPLYFVIRQRKFLFSSIVLISALLLVCSWIFKVEKMTGRFIMINDSNSENIFFGNNQWTPMYKTWLPIYTWSRSENEEFVAFIKEIRKNPRHIQDKLYKQYAVSHILSRPDLFLLRTLNRVRAYFAFDTFTGSVLIKDYGIKKRIGLSIIVADAIFYCSIMSLAILFLFLPSQIFGGQDSIRILISVILTYSLPYWLSSSHPTYHFPIVPISGILAVTYGASLLSEPRVVWNWKHILSSKRRKYLALFGMILFVYIQIEWIVMMYSRI